ncbi:MAG: DUF3604 domain-containing protein [Spirochaetaceae bacterium]|nr:DUF3604 domain-containing protein [Spirochaetaceae bacterium]
MSRILAIVAIALLVVLGLWLRFVARGGLGEHESPGHVTERMRSAAQVAETTAEVALAANEMLVSRPKQILFGDLHVHTTFSFDAFMLSLPLQGGEGSHPPADACDFARFCSALDFWSINDHAESITPRHWAETVETIRACDAVAGQGAVPDTVPFLGWEWTQVGATPATHYGHKNVVLRDLEDGEIPRRPIGATGATRRIVDANPFGGPASGAVLRARDDERLHDLARFFAERQDLEICPLGVPVRELPDECVEMVETPDLLFEKLDDWDVASIVIPHGTTWGFYTPPGSDWAKQLDGPLHDDARQTLLEVFSGHGNSEVYRDWRAVRFDDEGRAICPEPTADYLPTCWRAGEIVQARCLADGESEETCAERAVVARQNAADAGQQAHLTVAGVEAAEWLDAGQCRDCERPAFNYRPGGAAQYIMALSNFDTPDESPRRFRFGFMASSDNHFARPGTGYKPVHRVGFTESRANPQGTPSALQSAIAPPKEAPASESRRFDAARSDLQGFALMEMERQASFFTTGGLVAAHAEDRSRAGIWDALERREVYGTSGPRILLWFDLINPPGTSARTIPMGGEVETRQNPIFQVRAVGSFEQQPGCPEDSATALGPERLAHVCKGECYNPSPTRRPITRIEVVRIRPQNAPGEPIAPLIEDPWRVFECDGGREGCAVTFDDPDYAEAARDAVYYVRAIEAEAMAINAGGVRCRRDGSGRCLETDLCRGDASDDCLAPHEPRAWSSPIFVDYARAD